MAMGFSSPLWSVALSVRAVWHLPYLAFRHSVCYGLSLLPPSHHDIRNSGIIYSDIGTSPLYVLNGIWSSSGPVPPKDDVIGGISAIVWSLTLLPLLKYVRALFLPFPLQRSTFRNANRSLFVCALARTKVWAALFTTVLEPTANN